MGRRSRDKGCKGELEVVRLLRVVFPLAARRAAGEESQERQGVDLKGTPGLCAQVQLAAAPTIERKFAEALAAHRPGEELPVAFTRRCSRSRSGEWLATLRASDLVVLLRLLPRHPPSGSVNVLDPPGTNDPALVEVAVDPDSCDRGCGRTAVRSVAVFGAPGGPGASANLCETCAREDEGGP